MIPWTAGDVCEHFDWNPTTLKYWRQRGFPEPRWYVGGKRQTACWRKADVIAWDLDRRRGSDFAAGLALVDQLGTVRGGAHIAGVPSRTFREFLLETDEHHPTGAVRVLEAAARFADDDVAVLLRRAATALRRL